MIKMTKALENAMKKCPKDKWFTKWDTIHLRRATYMLDRLVDAGKLEFRINGSLENLYREYRVL